MMFNLEKKLKYLTANAATLVIVFLMPLGPNFESLAGDESIKVMFSPKGGVKERLLEKISNASCSIDAALYSFSDTQLWEQLSDKAKEGVKIRLILNKSAFKDSYSKCKNCGKLLSQGGEIKFHSLTMHHKFAIFDEQCDDSKVFSSVVTGSGNWSRSSNLLYDEDFLEFQGNKNAVDAFSGEFQYIWNYSRSFPELIQTVTDTVSPDSFANFFFTSSNMYPRQYRGRWTFSKRKDVDTGVATSQILRAIAEAKSEILVATAHFRKKDIYNALLDAYRRGIKIVLITDGQEYNSTYKKMCKDYKQSDKQLDECLQLLGVAEVYYKYYSIVWDYKTAKQMHSKYLIVDRQKVLTGSFNWSLTAEFKNLENLIEINDSSVVGEYVKNFFNILSYGNQELGTLKNEIAKKDGVGPCHFSPITIPGSEIKKIRKLMKKGSCR